MIINWHGQFCFQITINKKEGQTKIIIDQFDKTVGLKTPTFSPDILLLTHKADFPTIKGDFFIINGPGEYEIKEIFIQGVNSQEKENTIYTIEAEDIKMCHLGKVNQTELTEKQIEKIGEVDILFIPVGGASTIEPEESLKIIHQVEPKIIIPMSYHLPGLKVKLASLDKFLKAFGQKTIEPLDKLVIKNKDLREEKMNVMVLKP